MESEDDALDALHSEFSRLQQDSIPEDIAKEPSVDLQWASLGKIKRVDGSFKYSRLSKVMLSILTIPHSNAECERIFSQVRKTRTQFRSSLSNQTLENILVVKSGEAVACYNQTFSDSFLHRAKQATTVSLASRTLEN